MIFCVAMFLLLMLTMLGQLFLPVIKFQSAGMTLEAHIFLSWSLFYVLALAVPYPVMLFFAVTIGFMWDAHWMTPRDGGLTFGPFGCALRADGLICPRSPAPVSPRALGVADFDGGD